MEEDKMGETEKQEIIEEEPETTEEVQEAPPETAAEEPVTTEAPAEAPATGKTIMIVDDEPDVRATVKTVLEKNGYNVITAVNGDDCLEKLKTEKPDLILMDIMMPGTPVKDVVKQITGIKIAYLSVVRTTEAEKEELLGPENIVDFIQKPFDINDLLERVKKIVG